MTDESLDIVTSSQDEFGGMSPKSQLPACDHYREDDSIFRLVPPCFCRALASRSRMWRLPQHFRDIPRRPDVEDIHAEQLQPGITILSDGGIVYLKEGKGFPVENPHRM
jgi:hypothetical protein